MLLDSRSSQATKATWKVMAGRASVSRRLSRIFGKPITGLQDIDGIDFNTELHVHIRVRTLILFYNNDPYPSTTWVSATGGESEQGTRLQSGLPRSQLLKSSSPPSRPNTTRTSTSLKATKANYTSGHHGACQRYRPLAPSCGPGEAEAQAEAACSEPQLLLHGRQVPGLL